MSEVPTEINSLDSCIRFTELLYLLPCLVGTTIIDEDDLIIISLQSRQYRHKLTIDIGDILFFAIGRDDDGEEL